MRMPRLAQHDEPLDGAVLRLGSVELGVPAAGEGPVELEGVIGLEQFQRWNGGPFRSCGLGGLVHSDLRTSGRLVCRGFCTPSRLGSLRPLGQIGQRSDSRYTA